MIPNACLFSICYLWRRPEKRMAIALVSNMFRYRKYVYNGLGRPWPCERFRSPGGKPAATVSWFMTICATSSGPEYPRSGIRLCGTDENTRDQAKQERRQQAFYVRAEDTPRFSCSSIPDSSGQQPSLP